jgi:hypothetical protein
MKLPQRGGCQCGKIRYTITETPQLVHTCHCTDCQRLTSSAFSMGIVVAESAVRLSGVEHGHSGACPIAGGSTRGGFAPNAGLGFAARRGRG